MTVHVFTGPTVSADEVREILPDAVVHPPVGHGDLLRLACGQGDVLVIVDGFFHNRFPVRHKEILAALADGARVVGASSMGALRAAELHPYGMLGVGRVFELYRDGLIDSDDEVAVVHTPDGAPQSTALVSMRIELCQAVAEGAIDDEAARRLLELARNTDYVQRSWEAVRHLAAGSPATGRSLAAFMEWRRRAGGEDAKHADAVAALHAVAAGLDRPTEGRWSALTWRTRYLHHWTAQFRERAAEDGTPIPLLAELHHRQLYDREAPRRWRRVVLTWVLGGDGANTDSRPHADDATGTCADADDDAALSRATVRAVRRRGLSWEALSSEQTAYWLRADEIHGLTAEERVVRIVVRSAGITLPDCATGPRAAVLLADDGGREPLSTLADAWRTNAAVAASSPSRGIQRLRPALLRAHVAEEWGVAADDGRALNAAARDRGFADTEAAIEAARPFYLHRSGAGAAARGMPPAPVEARWWAAEPASAGSPVERRGQSPARSASAAASASGRTSTVMPPAADLELTKVVLPEADSRS